VAVDDAVDGGGRLKNATKQKNATIAAAETTTATTTSENVRRIFDQGGVGQIHPFSWFFPATSLELRQISRWVNSTTV
jgi:hypothetical protein